MKFIQISLKYLNSTFDIGQVKVFSFWNSGYLIISELNNCGFGCLKRIGIKGPSVQVISKTSKNLWFHARTGKELTVMGGYLIALEQL